MDLLPGRVGLAPHHGSPRRVERVQGDILFPKEFPEGQSIALGVEFIRLAVQLVVDLPAYDAGAARVMRRELFHDAGAQPAVHNGIVVVMSAHAVAIGRAVDAAVQHLRVFLSQPHRRRRGGRPEDDLHALRLRQVQEVVKERETENAFPGLEHRPTEFRHPNCEYTHCLHSPEVFPPKGSVPLLRIIAHPQGNAVKFEALLFPHVTSLLYGNNGKRR